MVSDAACSSDFQSHEHPMLAHLEADQQQDWQQPVLALAEAEQEPDWYYQSALAELEAEQQVDWQDKPVLACLEAEQQQDLDTLFGSSGAGQSSGKRRHHELDWPEACLSGDKPASMPQLVKHLYLFNPAVYAL